MTEDEKIKYIENRLKEVDEKSSSNYLVNFVDDIIDWNRIASVALEAAREVTNER